VHRTDQPAATVDATPARRRRLAITVIAMAACIAAGAAPGLAAAASASPRVGAVSTHHHPKPTKHHHPKKHHPKKHHHKKTHHPKKHHPKKKHHVRLEQVKIDGLVTSVHKGHVAVFATSSTVGHHTTHNTTVRFVLTGSSRRHNNLRKGYVVHLVGSGRGSIKHLRLPRVHTSHVTPTPASVLVGVVDRTSGGDLVVTQISRDDGSHSSESARHALSVDTSAATVTVDGAAGKVEPGDLVAVLGEVNGNYVLASRVYAFDDEADALVGDVKAVDGDTVTVRSEGFDTQTSLGSGSSQVPLFIDGASAATDQLAAHDRIVVLGVVDEEEEGFVPQVAFAFDGHDKAPCGDNPPPRHHRG
jgi:hypothetical protein